MKPARFRSILFACALPLLWAACSSDAPPPSDPPQEFAIADTAAGRPTVAVDPESSAVYVAWAHRLRDTTSILLARLDPGALAPSEPVRVNHLPGDAAGHDQAPAQVAAGPDGTVYVAWITQRRIPGRRFPASDIRLARSSDGGRTFDPAVTVNEDPGFPTGHHFHNLTVGPDGTVYVSWLDSSERDRALLEEKPAGLVPASLQPGGHAGHQEHGGEEKDRPGTALLVARSTDGGRTFTPGVVVARGTCECCRTALATDPDGTLYVAWRHIFGDNIRDMAVARSVDGGRTFSVPVRVHEDGWQIDGCPHAGPALAAGAGGIHLVWYTGAQGKAGIYHARSGDGGATFQPAVLLEPEAHASSVSAAVAGSGVLAAWENTRLGAIRLAPLDQGAQDARASLDGEDPALAVRGDTQIVVWRGREGIRLRVLTGSTGARP